MKTGILTTKTITSKDIEDTKSIMGMSSKGMEMAQYFLRDKIYSDKVLAVIREYISNAYDEHVKYRITESVQVSLKAVNGQWVWSVRDYAMGLNEHDIRNIFGVYFESTKSQENTSIGGFGIGGKAGFSYTDTFYVASHHNGTKTNYVCTLGAGDKGIPVGEIYKVSEEPTSEQGIEISLEVKNSDVHDFSQKTTKFVEFFSPEALVTFEDGHLNATVVPLNPIYTQTVDGFRLASYERKPYHKYDDSTYYIRMGGVVYPHTASNPKRRLFSNPLIVDVPIGKLSIPISRESIENTPLNEKVFVEIEKMLDDISLSEINNLTVPKFGSLITGNSPFNSLYEAQWFKHSFNECFPSTRHWYYYTGRILTDTSPTTATVYKGDTKFIVYLLPDIKSLSNWHKRLINALIKVKGADYNGYVWMKITDYDKLITELDKFIDITDCSFVDVKSLKLPKLERDAKSDNEKFVVYTSDYGYKNYYSAKELDDYVRKHYFDDKDLEDDWFSECKSLELVHRRTIGKTDTHGTRAGFWTANSIKMINNLKELGWLTPNCPDYIVVKDKFEEKRRIQRMIDNASYEIEKLYYGIKPSKRILDYLKRKPENIVKFRDIKNAILNENSTRSRILKSIREYNQSITRKDLRKILQIRD